MKGRCGCGGRVGWDDALLVLNKGDGSYKTRNINGQEADKDKETDYPLEHIFLIPQLLASDQGSENKNLYIKYFNCGCVLIVHFQVLLRFVFHCPHWYVKSYQFPYNRYSRFCLPSIHSSIFWDYIDLQLENYFPSMFRQYHWFCSESLSFTDGHMIQGWPINIYHSIVSDWVQEEAMTQAGPMKSQP